MCVAITMEPGTTLTREECDAMYRQNNDGCGIAFAKDGKVWWIKGVKIDAKRIHRLVERYKDYPRLVHFRLTTAGGTLNELCHPFAVDHLARCKSTGVAPAAMIHNGHWGDWDDIMKVLKEKHLLPDNGPWSDTRLAAYLISSDRSWMEQVDGKVAILEGNGDIVCTGYWHDLRPGIQVSNTHWNWSQSSYSRMSWDDWYAHHYAEQRASAASCETRHMPEVLKESEVHYHNHSLDLDCSDSWDCPSKDVPRKEGLHCWSTNPKNNYVGGAETSHVAGRRGSGALHVAPSDEELKEIDWDDEPTEPEIKRAKDIRPEDWIMKDDRYWNPYQAKWIYYDEEG